MKLDKEQFLEIQVAFIKARLLIIEVEKSKLIIKLILQGMGIDPNKDYLLDEEKLTIEEVIK